MTRMIKCECGFSVQSDSEQKLVTDTQQHARQFHKMDLTRDQVLAMAQPVSSKR